MTSNIRRNILQTCTCSVCGSKYVDISIGKSHIIGSCPKCERRDEIGLVFFND